MANYGGYGQTGRGGYGQSNPYEQEGGRYNHGDGNPYAQQGGNPYAQQPPPTQPSYGGGRTQQGGYDSRTQQGGYDNRYGGDRTQPSAPPAGGAAYSGGNDMEMGPVNGRTGGAYSATPGRDPNAILNECRDIERSIDEIGGNVKRVGALQQRALDDPDASQGTQTNRELDKLTSITIAAYHSLGERLKVIKQKPESGDPRNKAQVGLVDRKLKQAITEYRGMDATFSKKLAHQMERQFRIVRPDASEQEVREAVQDTSNTQVFSQALMTSNRRGQSQSALRAVQGRHEAIQKIERQMVELAQLFQDMEAAVVQQEDAVGNIDDKVGETHMNISKGNEQLDQAVVKAASARRKKWICLGIVILIILIIAAIIVLVLKFATNVIK